MDNVSVRDAREFLNLSVEQPRMHLLDEPTGYISAMGKSNLGHQMRYSVERLEAELAGNGEPRVAPAGLRRRRARAPGVDALCRRPQVRPRNRRVRPCVLLRSSRCVHGRVPRSRTRRRPPLPQRA